MLQIQGTHVPLYSKSYLLEGGTAIPRNSNMNNYDTPGNYVCSTYGNGQTLENAPFNNAFLLKVGYATGDGYPCQTYTEYNTGRKAYRFKDAADWQPYVYFSDDATVLKSNFEISTTESYAGDCNGITKPGLCNQVINPYAVNGPGQYAYIVVYKASYFNMLTQIALPYNVDGALKVRTRENGIWKDWRAL